MICAARAVGRFDRYWDSSKNFVRDRRQHWLVAMLQGRTPPLSGGAVYCEEDVLVFMLCTFWQLVLEAWLVDGMLGSAIWKCRATDRRINLWLVHPCSG